MLRRCLRGLKPGLRSMTRRRRKRARVRTSASVVADEDAGRRVRPGERQACREPRTLDEVDALRGRPPTDPTLSSREEVIVSALGSSALPHRNEHSIAERSGVAAAKSRFGRSWPNSILSTRRYIVPTLGHRDVVEVVLHKVKVVERRSFLRPQALRAVQAPLDRDGSELRFLKAPHQSHRWPRLG
jgi:hypothetical protein